MAIFEQQNARKVLVDDTAKITCIIENWHQVNGHTEFVIRIQRGAFTDDKWKVHRRYNDFVKLHSQLQVSGIPLPLPPKKILGNMEPSFVAERQQALQKYLDLVFMNPILASSLPARAFVDPANYCQPFSEIALQHVSLALRGEVGWQVVEPLPEIGWRLRKHYYQVKCKSSTKEELLASWTDYGPDKYVDEKDLHSIFKSFSQIQHPYIHQIDLCICNDIGGLVVRTSHKNGSLRDLLCGAKPRQSFLKKYGNPNGHKPLEMTQISLYGRQILEALKFLHDKGLPFGHLHSGNVVIDENNRVKLLDIENGVLGVPSFYRPYFIQHKKINSCEAVDVYCFGHTLYEMAFGRPLQESVFETLPSGCPTLLKAVLESILSVEACKNGLPTLESLLNHPLFSSIILTLYPNDKAHLKLSATAKEQLKLAQSQMEERLREEQKMIRSQKRLVKVQELMSSEEEKKKQRHKMRQEQRQLAKQKSRQENDVPKDKPDGLNGERSDSVNSSATTSLGTRTPPSASGSSVPSPPPPPPPPPPMACNGAPKAVNSDNKAFQRTVSGKSIFQATCPFKIPKMTSKVLEVKEQLSASLHDTSKPWTPVLAKMEQKTGVNRLYIFVGVVAFIGLWLAFGYAAQLVCNTVGFLYPAYASIHALESSTKHDDTKWLTYWVVFAIFSIAEYFADFIVGWFPLYWLIKCLIFVWLMIPIEFNGSQVIYTRLVRPYFLQHHSKVDESIKNLKMQAAKLLEKEN